MSNDFLKLLEKQLDDNQSRCCTVRENAVIKAGAGSGKTQVFSNRFSWLIMRDEQPLKINKILTLTFTNKAAAEMYHRIYQTLKDYAHTDVSDSGKRKLISDEQIERAKTALNSFSKANIQTLDSYCGDLVRKHATKLGLSPNFAIASKENDRFLEQQALAFVISNKENEGIKHFVQPGKFEDFSSTLAEMIKSYTSLITEKNYFSKCLQKQKEQIENDEKLIDIDYLVDKIKSFESNSKYYEKIALVLNAPICSVWQFMLDIAGISQTGEQNADFKEFINEEIKAKKSLAIAVISFKNEYEYLVPFCEFLDKFLELINENKRINGSLSFKDVQDLALYLLKTDKTVQTEESKRFDQIMIDEFQDNNVDNRDMLLLLCGVPADKLDSPADICSFLKKNSPEKLYFVGDEKQSIYRFREADVKVFNSLEEIIGQKKGSLFMSYNYRSRGELLSSFNLIFGGMEPKEIENKRSNIPSLLPQTDSCGCEAGFPESAYIMQRKNDEEVSLPEISDKNCQVEMWLQDKEDIPDYKKENIIPQFIACKIKELKKAGTKYSDIAILDRSRGKRSALCRYLTNNGIPYVLDEEKELFSDGPVNDVYAALKLMCNDNSPAIWSTFLCSPFVGMCANEAINCLCAEKHKKEITDEKYGNAKKLLSEIKKHKYDSLTDILNYLWYDLGYVFNVKESNVTESFAKQFDILFELARQAEEGGKNLLWYTTQLEKRKTKEDSQRADQEEDSELDVENVNCPVEQNDAVKIMTIHKSKGLQFKNVFAMGCLSYSSKGNRNFFYSDNKTGVSVKLKDGNYFYESRKDEIKKEEVAEFKRLIYVALTRASQRVFIVGDKAELDKNIWSSLDSNPDVFYYKKATITPTDLIPVELEETSKKKDLVVKTSFAAHAEKRISPSALEVLYKEPENSKPEEVPYEEVNNLIINSSFKFSDFGTLAHKVMENLVNGIDNRKYDWNEMNFVVEQDKFDRLLMLAIQMSEAFVKTDIFKEIEKSNFKKTEWSFKTYQKNSYISGSIDLLFRDTKARYVIVDYKTDQSPNNKEKYINQQKLYREIAVGLIKATTKEVIKEEDISCYLFYLRYGKLVDITKDCNSTTITEDTFAQAIEASEC